MILPDRKEAIHKAWLYRLLISIYDNFFLSSVLCFKGGTCAAMRGFLNRYSIDLDFDFIGTKHEIIKVNKIFENIFKKLGLQIKDQSEHAPQYFLKYYNPIPNERNTLKIDVTLPPPRSNKYEKVRLIEIDRVVTCQTTETMFANKLVALIDRYEKSGSIAGRDLYDIHHYFLQGFTYEVDVIKERRMIDNVKAFFSELIIFIETHISQTIINQDLNMLLLPDEFRGIRKTLKSETLMFLRAQVN